MKTNILIRLTALISAILLLGCDSGGGGGGPSNPITVAVLGDSESSGGNYPGIPPWPSLLAQEEPEWTVINLAVSGSTSATGVNRIGTAISRSADVIVIMYGANNAIQSQSPAALEQDLLRMVGTAKAAGARVVLVDIMPFFGARSIYNGNSAAMNSVIASVASRERVQLARASNAFRGSDAASLFPDGLHPNLDGTRILYRVIREKINSAASGL